MELTTFVEKVFRKNLAWTSVDWLMKKVNSTGVTERLKNIELFITSNSESLEQFADRSY